MRMEHRWGRREATNLEVHFVAHGGATGTGRVRNFSLTGAYLETQAPLRRLALVYLEFPASGPPEDDIGPIAATVVRQDAHGVGLEWCELPDRDRSCSIGRNAAPERASAPRSKIGLF